MRFEVQNDASVRLDVYLTGKYPEKSRTVIANWIKDGRVTVDGKPAKANRKLNGGEIVTVDEPAPEPSSYEPEDIPLTIVYEDEFLAVIDKPAGMVVHPAPGIRTGTLVNALLYHMRDALSQVGGTQRPGIVHRLDKDTAGLLVVAKDDQTHRLLSEALAKRDIHREYEAIVYGAFPTDRGTIDEPIGRSRSDSGKMSVRGRAMREACTHYEVLERLDQVTRLRVILDTGRTHQIRVHMASTGHPILGDPLYGIKKERYNLPYQMLHAVKLTFTHPRTGEELSFTSELTEPYRELLRVLRIQNGQ